MAPTRLPRSVRIGPLVWAVSEDEAEFHKATHRLDNIGANGVCDTEKITIHINPDVSPQYKREVFHHEIMHACFATAGQPPLDDEDCNEERFIQVTSPWYLLMLRDNPRVLAYLLETS